MSSEPAFPLFLDCGAFTGDGQSAPKQRSFALICGQIAVLCSFFGTKPFTPLGHIGPPEERDALNKVLLALAGPMRLDITLHAWESIPTQHPTPDRHVYLLLPGPRLPLVTPMPDLNPELIPDPTRANCPCHGPVVTRMLYGTPEAPSRYRAVGALLSRNPSDWFYLMAESHRECATDFCKLLDRITRLSLPIQIIVLGPLWELWTGYRCVFQGSGRAAFIAPEILTEISEEALSGHWLSKVMNTKSREAITRFLRLPKARRSVLGANAFEREGVWLADGSMAYRSIFPEEPPLAFLALREQKAQFKPWRKAFGETFRYLSLITGALRWQGRQVGMYATAHGGEPLLTKLEGRAA